VGCSVILGEYPRAVFDTKYDDGIHREEGHSRRHLELLRWQIAASWIGLIVAVAVVFTKLNQDTNSNPTAGCEVDMWLYPWLRFDSNRGWCPSPTTALRIPATPAFKSVQPIYATSTRLV
jgi:hypothetical protein